ncbi:hypothetical protein MBLNU457_4697t1 [Dothideomycetes sp. NU457]
MAKDGPKWPKNSSNMAHNNAHSPWTNSTIDAQRADTRTTDQSSKGESTNGKPIKGNPAKATPTKRKPTNGTPTHKNLAKGNSTNRNNNPRRNKALRSAARPAQEINWTEDNDWPQNTSWTGDTSCLTDNGKWPAGEVRMKWDNDNINININEERDNDVTYHCGFRNTGRNKEETPEQIGLRKRIRDWQLSRFERFLFDLQIIPKEMHALPPTETSRFVRFKIIPEEGEAEERIFEFTPLPTRGPYGYEIYDATPGKPRLHINDVLASLPQPNLQGESPQRLSNLQQEWYKCVNSRKQTHSVELRVNAQQKPRADWSFERKQQIHVPRTDPRLKLQAAREASQLGPFLGKLPQEVRNEIYSHVFPSVIEPKPINSRHRGPWKLDPLSASLLLVSRACYRQFSDHIFTSHTFRFDFPTLFRYLAGYGFKTEREFDPRRAVLHKIKHLELAFDHDGFMLFFGVKFRRSEREYLQRKTKAWGNLKADLLLDLPFVKLTLTFDDSDRTWRTDRVEAVETILQHAVPFLRGRDVSVQGGVTDDQRDWFRDAINPNPLADSVTGESSAKSENPRGAWNDDAHCGAKDITSTTSWATEGKDDPEEGSRSRAASKVKFGADSATQDALAGAERGRSEWDLDTNHNSAQGSHKDHDFVMW